MAREINRLNARSVTALQEVGRHADGNGLYLSISENGGRRWVFLYRRNGKLREKGLGSARSVSLKAARDLAQKVRDDLANGKDPLEVRQPDACPTFAECATAYMDAHRPGWRNPIHARQWETTLATYAYPVIGTLPVSDVDTDHVLKFSNRSGTRRPKRPPGSGAELKPY
jgi:hypothetical protein